MHSHTDAHAPTKEQNKTIPNAVQKPFFNQIKHRKTTIKRKIMFKFQNWDT